MKLTTRERRLIRVLGLAIVVFGITGYLLYWWEYTGMLLLLMVGLGISEIASAP